MNQRAKQREGTRARIVEAAIACFAESGFQAASTRQIATRAGTNQGLITYHFKSKEALWQAAADGLFGALHAQVAELAPRLAGRSRKERAREGIRLFVRFAAAHPELFRFMLDVGKHDNERLAWLVETHLQPTFSGFPTIDAGRSVDDAARVHLQYILLGAGSLIFANAPEVRRLTGVDPMRDEAVERHADLVADLMVR